MLGPQSLQHPRRGSPVLSGRPPRPVPGVLRRGKAAAAAWEGGNVVVGHGGVGMAALWVRGCGGSGGPRVTGCGGLVLLGLCGDPHSVTNLSLAPCCPLSLTHPQVPPTPDLGTGVISQFFPHSHVNPGPFLRHPGVPKLGVTILLGGHDQSWVTLQMPQLLLPHCPLPGGCTHLSHPSWGEGAATEQDVAVKGPWMLWGWERGQHRGHSTEGPAVLSPCCGLEMEWGDRGCSAEVPWGPCTCCGDTTPAMGTPHLPWGHHTGRGDTTPAMGT